MKNTPGKTYENVTWPGGMSMPGVGRIGEGNFRERAPGQVNRGKNGSLFLRHRVIERLLRYWRQVIDFDSAFAQHSEAAAIRG